MSMRAPLYAAAALACIMLAVAAIFTFLRPEPGGFATWQASGGLAQSERTVLPSATELDFAGEGRASLGIIPLPPRGEGETADFAAELADVLTQLTQAAPVQTAGEDTDPALPDAYGFIPQGLTLTDTSRSRTPSQQSLYEYGNAVGGMLLAFADTHPNMPQVLKDQAEDRDDPLKASVLKRLAGDFVALAEDLAILDPVPPEAASAHQTLVAAYRDVGEKLAVIPDASGDQAFLDAIYAYNTTAENLSKRLVALVDLFVAQGVRFSQSDPGGIFTFSAGGI